MMLQERPIAEIGSDFTECAVHLTLYQGQTQAPKSQTQRVNSEIVEFDSDARIARRTTFAGIPTILQR
jgi:hypothetical protein